MHFEESETVKTEELSNYFIYTINKNIFSEDNIRRSKLVLNEHMPDYIKQDLMPLCEKYADIFA